MWENACYLLPDERRSIVFGGLRKQVGLNPKAILNADADILLALATMGGMRPTVRVFRWQEIARITMSQFDGGSGSDTQTAICAGQESAKAVPEYRRPRRGKDIDVLRRIARHAT